MDKKTYYRYTKHCFSCFDLYRHIKPSKWGIPRAFRWEVYPEDGKRLLCSYVLAYLFYLIFCDIIENNVTFSFPLLMGKKGYIYVKCFQGDLFKSLYSRGVFSGIDFLKSEFKGYRLYIQWEKGRFFREKPIYLSYKMKKWFYHQINSGKQYY